ADNISVHKTITITFSAAAKKGRYFSKIKLSDINGKKVSSTLTIVGNTLTVDPRRYLGLFSSQYTLVLPAGSVANLSSNQPLAAEYSINFTTEPPHPPAVSSSTPADDGEVLTLPTITVSFTEPVVKGSKFSRITLIDNTTLKKVSLNKVLETNLVVTPKSALVAGRTYTLTVPAGAVKDDVRLNMTADYVITFTVVEH
ncbi:MAG: Ig-like domain-containing protein, partial [Chitinophagales bacterium]